LKIKLKGHNFDTTEMIEAESQAVLNTLTEHDFQDAFINGRSAGNGHTRRWPQGPKLVFYQMRASVPTLGFNPDFFNFFKSSEFPSGEVAHILSSACANAKHIRHVGVALKLYFSNERRQIGGFGTECREYF
jgi:hypothetical protein